VVAGALSQNIACEIIIADFASEDDSRAQIQRAIDEAPQGAKHDIKFLTNDEPTTATMHAVNKAIAWMVDQTDAEWIFQCSSDDYSLPNRVRHCLNAVAKHDCAGVATTMYFVDDTYKDTPLGPQVPQSGFPRNDGYVGGAEGIFKMAYGSTIWAYKRDFLKKVGLDVPCTLDVYLGYLASLDAGYYVVANPQHVHYMAADNENIGFQGKMRAAEKSGDQAQIDRINELNRFQLFELYYESAKRAQALYPMAHDTDKNALMQMMLSQSCGWYEERRKLHVSKTTPLIM
jgi:hypothetical protein